MGPTTICNKEHRRVKMGILCFPILSYAPDKFQCQKWPQKHTHQDQYKLINGYIILKWFYIYEECRVGEPLVSCNCNLSLKFEPKGHNSNPTYLTWLIIMIFIYYLLHFDPQCDVDWSTSIDDRYRKGGCYGQQMVPQLYIYYVDVVNEPTACVHDCRGAAKNDKHS